MVRVDAFATLRFFYPLRRMLWRAGGLPILMYHSVSRREEKAHPYYRTVTSPEAFAAQMQYLSDRGYSAINLEEAAKRRRESCTGSRREVAITFDDGFRDFYTSAFPILNRHGFTATMFLPTAHIGNSTQSFKGVDCMTWSEVREMHRAGIHFGSHTVTHPQLVTLTEKQVEYEVKASKDRIEQELGCAASSFSYPYAFPETNTAFVGMLRRHLQQVGYVNGVSTIIGTAGPADDALFLRRLPVNTCDDRALLEAKLAGGYDWLHTAQAAWKRLAPAKRKQRGNAEFATSVPGELGK